MTTDAFTMLPLRALVLVAIIAIVSPWPGDAAAAVTSCSGTAGSFGGGAGTSADPYRVATQAHLAAVATGANRLCAYRQTQDIALSGEWTPLGTGGSPFKGEYDGDNRAITGLSITTNGSYLGLFGYTDGGAEIKNIRLAGTVNVPGSTGVGALVGLADRPTTITNVHSSVNVTARNLAGGLVGWVAEAIIRRSSSSGTVTVSEGSVGGLVGKARSSFGNLPAEISDSYATGAVTGGVGYEGVAGLVGFVDVGGGSYSVTIARSFSSGAVTGGTGTRSQCYGMMGCFTTIGTTGGLLASQSAGTTYTANLTVNGAFWDTQTSNRATSADNLGTGLTTVQARTRSTYTAASWDIANGWSATAVWGICDGSTYPFLTAQHATSPCAPDAPAAPTAVAGDGRVTITVSRGAGGGGTPTSYIVQAVEDPSRTCTVTGAAGSCDITGLTNGTAYTFTATASSSVGTSAASAPSAAVTPEAPPAPTTPRSSDAATETPASAPQATSPAPAATMTPSGIRWSDGRRTTTAIVATFAAAPDTTYLISATPETGASAARTARIVRGTCEIEVRAQDARRTARCTIRLRAAATWRVSITPVTGGVKGVAATKRIRVTLPIPDRPTGADGSSEPVTG